MVSLFVRVIGGIAIAEIEVSRFWEGGLPARQHVLDVAFPNGKHMTTTYLPNPGDYVLMEKCTCARPCTSWFVWNETMESILGLVGTVILENGSAPRVSWRINHDSRSWYMPANHLKKVSPEDLPNAIRVSEMIATVRGIKWHVLSL